MIKEYIEKNQPIFYTLLENEFTNKKIPHAFLLSGVDTKRPKDFITMSLICDKTLACEQCNDCKRVMNNQYADVIHYDGSESSIKKQDIEYIQEQFKKSSLEGKAKVYVIENIENSSKEAMNALLKMLEEPIDGIYAVFTTKNLNKVLPTIKSRCQVLDIIPDNKDELYHQLLDCNVDDQNARILSQLTNNKDDALMLNDERFDYLMLQAINFIEDMFLYRNNLIINTQTNLLKNYKTKEDIKLFLNLVEIGLKDMFHVKHSKNINYINSYDLLHSLEVDNNDIISKIEKILETIYRLDTKANIPLLMDSLMYRL